MSQKVVRRPCQVIVMSSKRAPAEGTENKTAGREHAGAGVRASLPCTLCKVCPAETQTCPSEPKAVVLGLYWVFALVEGMWENNTTRSEKLGLQSIPACTS
eukprot:285530-Amphidinium_carterae.1